MVQAMEGEIVQIANHRLRAIFTPRNNPFPIVPVAQAQPGPMPQVQQAALQHDVPVEDNPASVYPDPTLYAHNRVSSQVVGGTVAGPA